MTRFASTRLLDATVVVPAGNRLGECATWQAGAERLLWTDIDACRLHSLSTGGACRQWPLPERCGSFALTSDPDVLLLALEQSLAFFHLETCRLEPVATLPSDAGLRSNDGRCDRAGNFVFGMKDESGAARGRFWQWHASGRLRPVEGLPRVDIPNSLAFSADPARVFWSDSARGVVQVGDYDADEARVSKLRVFSHSSGRDRDGEPDGACLDADGGLWIARWGAGEVLRYTADGKVDAVVRLPVRRPTCVAIGGPELRTLYITTAAEDQPNPPLAGHLFAATVAQRGLAEPVFLGKGS